MGKKTTTFTSKMIEISHSRRPQKTSASRARLFQLGKNSFQLCTHKTFHKLSRLAVHELFECYGECLMLAQLCRTRLPWLWLWTSSPREPLALTKMKTRKKWFIIEILTRERFFGLFFFLSLSAFRACRRNYTSSSQHLARCSLIADT